MARPHPIFLLTDYGLEDAYAGVVRAVIAGAAPGVLVMDLTHRVPRGDITAGALQLWSAASYLPTPCVVVAVVDPGVGTERRPLCVTAGARALVGPDNGLLWPAAHRLAAPGLPIAWVLDRPEYWRFPVSSTFHGRDVFAPVAAALASGTPAHRLGTMVETWERLELPTAVAGKGRITGEVIWVDAFGNAVTSIAEQQLNCLQAPRIHAGGRDLGPLRRCYAEVGQGQVLALVGSTGLLEVAVNGGSAAHLLGLARGDQVEALEAAQETDTEPNGPVRHLEGEST